MQYINAQIKFYFFCDSAHILFHVGVGGKVAVIRQGGVELKLVMDHAPDGVNLLEDLVSRVHVHPLNPVSSHLHIHPGKLRLPDPAADTVRRLQDQQVGDPGMRQHLPCWDPYVRTYVYM